MNDFRYAFRTLVKSPGFTSVSVLMIALGVGAATSLFSLTCGVLLRLLPWPEPDRIGRLPFRSC